jgi:hypothetical protein
VLLFLILQNMGKLMLMMSGWTTFRLQVKYNESWINSKNFYLNANPFSEPKALVSAANSDVMKNLSQGKLPKEKSLDIKMTPWK